MSNIFEFRRDQKRRSRVQDNRQLTVDLAHKLIAVVKLQEGGRTMLRSFLPKLEALNTEICKLIEFVEDKSRQNELMGQANALAQELQYVKDAIRHL